MIDTKKKMTEAIIFDFAHQHNWEKSYSIKQYILVRLFSLIGFEGYQIDRFKYLLRKTEYYRNKGFYFRYFYHKFLKERWARKLGFNIPENVCSEGLRLGHAGPIIINKSAKIGSEVTLHVGINIASNCIIGDRVYIGPGAKFISECLVPNNSKVGANAVVSKKFTGEGLLLVGIPATNKRK